MMNDLGVSILFHKRRHMLDRPPAGDVPVLSLAEDAVQQPRGTQKPDMAAMQRRDGPTSRNVLVRHQQRRRLFPCARLRQQVFQQVVGKAAIAQRRLPRRRNGIGWARAWLQLRQSQETAIEANARELPLIVLNGRASDIAPHAEDRNLPVLDRIGIGHAKDVQAGEVGTQDAGAVVQPLERDHQNQNAFHSQPAVGMFQEHSLHAPIRNGADLGVIRRIQIQQRERFGPRNGVEGIALDGLDAVGTGDPRAFGIKFDAIAPNRSVAGDKLQRSSLSYAGIDHRSRPSEGEQRAKLFPSLSGNG